MSLGLNEVKRQYQISLNLTLFKYVCHNTISNYLHYIISRHNKYLGICNFLLCTFSISSPGHVYFRIMTYIKSSVQCVANYCIPQELLLNKNGWFQVDGKVEGSEKKSTKGQIKSERIHEIVNYSKIAREKFEGFLPSKF